MDHGVVGQRDRGAVVNPVVIEARFLHVRPLFKFQIDRETGRLVEESHNVPRLNSLQVPLELEADDVLDITGDMFIPFELHEAVSYIVVALVECSTPQAISLSAKVLPSHHSRSRRPENMAVFGNASTSP